MTKCLIECLITYFYYLTDDYVVCLFCHLPDVYRELLEPSLINRVLILDCPFNSYEPGLPTVLHLIFTFKIDRSFLYLRGTPIRLVSRYIQYTRYPQRWPRRQRVSCKPEQSSGSLRLRHQRRSRWATRTTRRLHRTATTIDSYLRQSFITTA